MPWGREPEISASRSDLVVVFGVKVLLRLGPLILDASRVEHTVELA